MKPLAFVFTEVLDQVPTSVNVLFIITVLLTVYLFYKASKSKTALLIIALWLAFQGILVSTGFYLDTKAVPPRLLLVGVPAMLFIVLLFFIKKGQQFLDSLDEKTLTLLHIIRIPMELVLYFLFVYKTIPQLMTFEGRNYDILSGLSAPLIYYFGYIKQTLGKSILILWNYACILLLVNIVVNAILSVETPFQQFGFDQPNMAILYFPYVWLPCCVVPLVFLSHFATLRKLQRRK